MNKKTSITLLLPLLFCACRAAGPSPTPSPTPVTATVGALEACDPELQARAMREGHIPAWESLDLSACYELELDLQPDSGEYTGGVQVTFINRTGVALPDLVFRAYPNARQIYGGSLEITSARVDGLDIEAEHFLSDGTGLRLMLPEPLGPGETVLVELDFDGRAPTNMEGLPQAYGVFNLSTDPATLTLANWYPILADFDDGRWRTDPVDGLGDAVVSETALYEVRLTAPEGWSLVTTGTRLEASTSEGRTSGLYVSGPVREFILLASPEFTLAEERLDGVTVRHWGLPQGEERWGEALEATLDSLEVFDRRFGPYPYAELDVVAVPLDNASGVEYPGVFLLLDTLYDRNEERPFLLGLVAAHEAAHQWWYGVVGSDVLRHPWQDEALTTFSSTLYMEEHQSPYYRGTLQFYQQTLDQLGPASDENAVGQPVDAFRDRAQLYGPVVYTKGALFFQALRERLGDRTFFEALREYYEQFSYRQAEPDDLLAAFERNCACDLDDLYEEWGVR